MADALLYDAVQRIAADLAALRTRVDSIEIRETTVSTLTSSDGTVIALTADGTGGLATTNNLTITNKLMLTLGGVLTIAGGAITITQSYHTVEGEGEVSDNLDTINGVTTGQLLILRRATAGHTITLRDDATGGGNLSLGASTRTLTSAYDSILLLAVDTQMIELAYVDNL